MAEAIVAGEPAHLNGEVLIGDARPKDDARIAVIALEAYEQYRTLVADWSRFSEGISAMPRLRETGELIVARVGGEVVGAVGYVSPSALKADYFDPNWAVIRLLAVPPWARGRGIGMQLTAECLRRAARDGATTIALHTTPVMEVALAMYGRLGFQKHMDIDHSSGLPYAVYTKEVGA